MNRLKSSFPGTGTAKRCTWVLVLFSIVAFTGAAQALSISQGDAAPDFTASTLDGQTVTLSQYRGAPVLVAFWSSWCSRCKEEMEFLKVLKDDYPGLNFLAINAESEEPDSDTIRRMEKAIREWAIPFTVLIDDGLRIWDLYGINALPTSFIVDADGTVVFAQPNFYFASPENFQNALVELFDPSLKYSRTEPETR